MQDPVLHYVLRLADTALINGQRLGEWCGYAPSLEEDLALANIGLDFLGRARILYQLACSLDSESRDEDYYAMCRAEREYQNLLIVEQPNKDFADTIIRQYLLAEFECLFFTALSTSTHKELAGLAQKTVKECRYHQRHAAEWVKKLGDGTDESNRRIRHALAEAWRFTDEFFDADDLDRSMATDGVGIDLGVLAAPWREAVEALLAEATLDIPDGVAQVSGSRRGVHTEHMGYLLADLQYMQRAYPNLNW